MASQGVSRRPSQDNNLQKRNRGMDARVSAPSFRTHSIAFRISGMQKWNPEVKGMPRGPGSNHQIIGRSSKPPRPNWTESENMETRRNCTQPAATGLMPGSRQSEGFPNRDAEIAAKANHKLHLGFRQFDRRGMAEDGMLDSIRAESESLDQAIDTARPNRVGGNSQRSAEKGSHQNRRWSR